MTVGRDDEDVGKVHDPFSCAFFLADAWARRKLVLWTSSDGSALGYFIFRSFRLAVENPGSFVKTNRSDNRQNLLLSLPRLSRRRVIHSRSSSVRVAVTCYPRTQNHLDDVSLTFSHSS